MNRLSVITRVLLAVAVVSMLAAYRLPMWEIQLWAPQYPEGLNMKIWLDHLSGDFEIINGLNHYIGMKMIREEMFPEFQYMGYALGFLIFMGLLPVITGRRVMLHVFVALLFVAAALGVYDFYRWGYDYGHNLDPKAAISVPGMSYDPPILGYKALLNFTAYSGPDTGGWVMIVSGAMATALLAWEWWKNRRKRGQGVGLAALLPFAIIPAVVFVLPGCDRGPQPIEYGKDSCAECNMTIVDKRFGSEFITGKGRVYKFDDINCMVEFTGRDPHARDADAKRLVVDFNGQGRFLDVESAVFLKHADVRSPMRSGVAAFGDKPAASAVGDGLGGVAVYPTWAEVLAEFRKP